MCKNFHCRFEVEPGEGTSQKRRIAPRNSQSKDAVSRRVCQPRTATIGKRRTGRNPRPSGSLGRRRLAREALIRPVMLDKEGRKVESQPVGLASGENSPRQRRNSKRPRRAVGQGAKPREKSASGIGNRGSHSAKSPRNTVPQFVSLSTIRENRVLPTQTLTNHPSPIRVEPKDLPSLRR